MSYQAGEIAKACFINKETLRYYERVGLIPEPPRSQSGYRLYPESTIQRIQFIKRLQGLDFSIKEIDKMLGIIDKDNLKCRDMYEFTSQKISDIEQKMKELTKAKNLLEELKQRCPDEKEMFECPIVDSLLEES
ncbi:Hg(II)-responsive transcriptional regulator [Chengkuizengella sediminis]|uniref:Hg(II)-responsive transcriptional regulator n=1 Tax=Chengkuizengella sediminis TaxID=1885917 RepID=UPI00138A185A|nr:Hg(II)-responsive transcriptional regulator [Chengkuizengella sediminis]NDI33864.1 Hg(II)-responsive transcriptional regulator [Chengkuizengella sediminis]